MSSDINEPFDSEPLPTDPLVALGPSIFIQILSHIPFSSVLQVEQVHTSWRDTVRSYSRSIWLRKCVSEGVEAKHIQMLKMIEKAGLSGHEPGEEESPSTGMDWRGICKKEIEWGRNWRFGRCRERWITMPDNAVWRFKVDEEQGTLISTSKTGGLHVVDLQTSKPQFSLNGVQPYAHLEQTKGFVMFNLENPDSAIAVYRTQPAISRSSHPTPPAESQPELSGTAHSYTNATYRWASHKGPLPRGHLAYYRTIVPRTECRAFRARLDYEGIKGKERAVLCAAGETHIYLWDLDGEGRTETIVARQQDDVQYVEFDEDYVFVCRPSLLSIYSRQSPNSEPITIPRQNLHVTVSAAILTQTMNEHDRPARIVPAMQVDGHTNDDHLWQVTPVSRTSLSAWTETDAPSRFGEFRFRNTIDLFFLALHFTPSDLVFASHTPRSIWIIRNYRRVLDFSLEEEERAWRIKAQMICIPIAARMKYLAVDRTHVTAATEEEIIFFDTSTLPTLPLELVTTGSPSTQQRISPIDIHTIKSTTGAGVCNTSCVQMDRRCIYATYDATVDGAIGGVLDPTPGSRKRFVPPARALEGAGRCVRIWDFGPV